MGKRLRDAAREAQVINSPRNFWLKVESLSALLYVQQYGLFWLEDRSFQENFRSLTFAQQLPMLLKLAQTVRHLFLSKEVKIYDLTIKYLAFQYNLNEDPSDQKIKYVCRPSEEIVYVMDHEGKLDLYNGDRAKTFS